MLMLNPAREIILRDYQLAAVEALRDGIRAGTKRQILCAPTGAGKCWGRDTGILMADGTIRPVQDIMPGDRLASPTGAPRTVLSTTQGVDMLYRVTPRKGEPFVCNAPHLLPMKVSGGKDGMVLADGTHIPAGQEDVTVEAETLWRSNATVKHRLKLWRAPVMEFDSIPLPLTIPPYILGIWMGDGSQNLAAITKPEGAVVDAWCDWGRRIGAEVRRDATGGRCPTWFLKTGRGQKNPALELLRGIGVLGGRGIPHRYLVAAPKDRLELLAGLLDTDGHLTHNGFDFISKHIEVAEDVAFLARSVGLAAYVRACRKGIAKSGFEAFYHRVSISGETGMIPTRQKTAGPRRQIKDALRTGCNIEPIGTGEYFGFELDGDRLCLLGDFTVQHNTVIASHLLREADRKGSYALFLVDRVALVDQTSQTLEDYGIRHGIVQGINDKYAPRENVQVCSIQTLARRILPRAPSLIIYDEAHCCYESSLKYIADNPQAVAIGLTATPFTPGMGKHWEALVNVTTTRALIDSGHLVEPTIFIARSPEDGELGLNSYGEFSDSSASTAGIRIVGDVVKEWIEKTAEHFGGPAKTIVFSPTVEHGRELCAAFAAAGFNFQQISYMDRSDAERADKIAEFRRPDSMIHGLVSCGVLTKGFDVSDVLVGVSCKPYRKSLSSHLQEIGRVMRPHGVGKRAIWLDHSGNIERFAVDMFDVWQNGAGALSDAEKRDKTPRERNEETRKAVVCPECSGALRGNLCMACGWEKPARSGIVAVEGELKMFDPAALGLTARAGLRAECLKDPRMVWDAALAYCLDHCPRDEQKARRWSYGVWRGVYPDAKLPRGWYDAARRPCDPNAYALVDREVARFRKRNPRRAA